MNERWFACGVVLVVCVLQTGCSPATAAGCGMGVAASVALVAASVAANNEASSWSRRPRARDLAATPARPRLVTARAELDGLTLRWLGSPRTHGTRVAPRFQRYARQSELATCERLEVRLDGETTLLPLAHTVTSKPPLVLETVQAEMDIATVKAMRDAGVVELGLCGTERRFDLSAASATKEFILRFDAEVPKAAPADGQPESTP